jgi:hypothetical protein
MAQGVPAQGRDQLIVYLLTELGNGKQLMVKGA